MHAAVIAAADPLPGGTRVALGVIAVAQLGALALLATELGVHGRARVVALALFALSPIVLQLEITYLPYGTSLTLGIAALAASLRSLRTADVRWGLAAGALWGLAVFARPYDGVLVLLVTAVSAWVAADDHRSLRRLATWGAVGAALPLVLLFAFNTAVTGDPLQLPFNLLEPADRLGFGERRALPTDTFVDFGPAESIAATGRNLVLVVAWSGGGLLAVVLAGWGCLQQRLRVAPVAATLLVWPLGYAFFWGSYLTAFVWDGALFMGPYYYLPIVPMLCLAAGAGWDAISQGHRWIGAGALVGMGALSLLTLAPALRDQIDRSSARVELADAVAEDVDGPALVFLPSVYGDYLQNPFSFLRNTPGLDGEVVFALEGDEARNGRVAAMFPSRSVYRVRLPRGWSDQPGFVPVVEIQRVS